MSRATQLQVSTMQAYSRIVAPFAGTVTWRYADTGALIQAGTSNSTSMPVVKLAQVNVLRLRIPVPESLVASVRIGTPAGIRVQGTGEQLTGKISRLTDAFDTATRTMQVEIDVPNADHRLSPGMYADVALQVAKRAAALTVPVQAIKRDSDKSIVLMVDQANRVQVRDILTGIQGANRVEVIAGLQEGDRVIVGNLNAYQAGETVSPKLSSLAEAGSVR